jgi:hypothetical protein
VGLLLFFGVAAVVVVVPLTWFLMRSRLKPGATHMVLLGAAAGEGERNLWIGALRSAGIGTHVVNVGDISGYYGPGPTAYSYEVWVRARDEARARNMLGL